MNHSLYKHSGQELPKVFSNVQRGALAFLVQDLRRLTPAHQPLVLVCSGNEQLDQLKAELTYLLPESPFLLFPEWNTIPYDRVSPDKDIMAQRVKTLADLKSWQQGQNRPQQSLILTTFRALSQRVVHPDAFQSQRLTLKPGMQLAYKDVLVHCHAYGLERVDVVRDVGSYAIRGGLIDIFPPESPDPFRIDFFGDEIETIKTFDPLSQRSLDVCSTLVLGAGNELILTDENRASFRIRYIQQFGVEAGNDARVQSLLRGEHPSGIEQWLPFFYHKLGTFFDWIPNACIVSQGDMVKEIDTHFQQTEEYYNQRLIDLKAYEQAKKMLETIYRPVPLVDFYLDSKAISALCANQQCIKILSHHAPDGVDLQTKPILIREKNPFESLLDQAHLSEKTLVTAGTEKPLTQIERTLKKLEGPALIEKKTFINAVQAKPQPNVLYGFISPFISGFRAEKFQLITYQDLFGIGTSGYQRAKKLSEHFSLQDLNAYDVGDYLVHRDHGVGRFLGLKSLSLNQADHDCVMLEYDEGAKLYIPVENLDVLTKYAGRDSEVTLDRLGTAHWQRRAAKVKKQLFEIAESLMAIAAKRQLEKRQGFDINLPAYEEFCAQFPYIETLDQKKAIQAVEEDLVSSKPMDRLICGDVGFGKTEIAMRAAFLAVMNGMQVLIIVPTTVLCQQHVQNFSKRFEGFSCTLGHLSRFTKPKEKKETLEKLKTGDVQILIATHGIFSKKDIFANLGLVIVDEEQHFGVMQKEYLKDLQPNVNVLAMSATPIPRTMQLAVAGTRGLSLIASPPVDRMAVKSHVLPFDTLVVRDAILRESQRGGQVYFVCPRLKDLEKIKKILKQLIPDLACGVGHGQLPAKELDEVMTDFYTGRYQVLLATNIVESGLDVANANTLIVYKAEYFGLAQLYQLKGRVGRSKKKAYAYFMTATEHSMQSKAYRRLEVIQSLDRLGAGFMVASHDMDLRGAGNLVGKAQSGHIKEVGYELYQELLCEAVEKIQSQRGSEQDSPAPQQATFSPILNLGLSVAIPENYIPDLSVRMGLYRRIAELTTLQDIGAFQEELMDRFGPLPALVQNLIASIELKQLCRKLMIKQIDRGQKGFILTFMQESPPNPDALITFVSRNMTRFVLRPKGQLLYLKVFDEEKDMIEGIKRVLQEFCFILLGK